MRTSPRFRRARDSAPEVTCRFRFGALPKKEKSAPDVRLSYILSALVTAVMSVLCQPHRRAQDGKVKPFKKESTMDTELQIAARQASDQKQAVLRQQSVVLGLKKEGGPRLDKATELLE